jgi:hypothetical protein
MRMAVKKKYSEIGPAGKVSHQHYGKVMRKDAQLAGTSPFEVTQMD